MLTALTQHCCSCYGQAVAAPNAAAQALKQSSLLLLLLLLLGLHRH
jgi:hypothetical protein